MKVTQALGNVDVTDALSPLKGSRAGQPSSRHNQVCSGKYPTSHQCSTISNMFSFGIKLICTYLVINKLSEFILPVTEYLSEWYNKVVMYMDGKGYGLFSYLPGVPVEEMKVAYKLVKTTMDGLLAVGDLVGSS